MSETDIVPVLAGDYSHLADFVAHGEFSPSEPSEEFDHPGVYERLILIGRVYDLPLVSEIETENEDIEAQLLAVLKQKERPPVEVQTADHLLLLAGAISADEIAGNPGWNQVEDAVGEIVVEVEDRALALNWLHVVQTATGYPTAYEDGSDPTLTLVRLRKMGRRLLASRSDQRADIRAARQAVRQRLEPRTADESELSGSVDHITNLGNIRSLFAPSQKTAAWNGENGLAQSVIECEVEATAQVLRAQREIRTRVQRIWSPHLSQLFDL